MIIITLIEIICVYNKHYRDWMRSWTEGNPVRAKERVAWGTACLFFVLLSFDLWYIWGVSCCSAD